MFVALIYKSTIMINKMLFDKDFHDRIDSLIIKYHLLYSNIFYYAFYFLIFTLSQNQVKKLEFKAMTKKGTSLTKRNALYFGEPCRNRTDNLMIKSHLLCQLS
jgi:hypothetical protein